MWCLPALKRNWCIGGTSPTCLPSTWISPHGVMVSATVPVPPAAAGFGMLSTPGLAVPPATADFGVLSTPGLAALAGGASVFLGGTLETGGVAGLSAAGLTGTEAVTLAMGFSVLVSGWPRNPRRPTATVRIASPATAVPSRGRRRKFLFTADAVCV